MRYYAYQAALYIVGSILIFGVIAAWIALLVFYVKWLWGVLP